jgi:hypothetical protein
MFVPGTNLIDIIDTSAAQGRNNNNQQDLFCYYNTARNVTYTSVTDCKVWHIRTAPWKKNTFCNTIIFPLYEEENSSRGSKYVLAYLLISRQARSLFRRSSSCSRAQKNCIHASSSSSPSSVRRGFLVFSEIGQISPHNYCKRKERKERKDALSGLQTS